MVVIPNRPVEPLSGGWATEDSARTEVLSPRVKLVCVERGALPDGSCPWCGNLSDRSSNPGDYLRRRQVPNFLIG